MRRRSTDLLDEFVPGDTEHVGEVYSLSGCRSDLVDLQHHTIRMCAMLANVLDSLHSQLACYQHATSITIDQDEDTDVEVERPDRREDRRIVRLGHPTNRFGRGWVNKLIGQARASGAAVALQQQAVRSTIEYYARHARPAGELAASWIWSDLAILGLTSGIGPRFER